ncbi:MAG: hypothetical protein IT233_04485 [Bacteroidia bacterium]|nr:hypothetical protein [Bacteroidia bacterium]
MEELDAIALAEEQKPKLIGQRYFNKKTGLQYKVSDVYVNGHGEKGHEVYVDFEPSLVDPKKKAKSSATADWAQFLINWREVKQDSL